MTNRDFIDLWNSYTRANTLAAMRKIEYNDARKLAIEANEAASARYEEYQKQIEERENLNKKLRDFKTNINYAALRDAIIEIVKEKCEDLESDLYFFYQQIIYGINDSDNEQLFTLAMHLGIEVFNFYNKE